MPRKDPEARRAYEKQHYLENRTAIHARHKQYRTENRKAIRARQKQIRLEYPERVMLRNAKFRSEKSGIVFDLKLEDIKIPTHCPLLGIPLVVGGGYNGRHDSPSLDRINSTKGYTRDNIWVISDRANTIKNDATLAELEMIVDGLRRKICSVGD